MYNILLPLSSLEIIPPELTTDLIFEFSGDFDEPYNARLDEMGYGNHNAIENIGSILYFIAGFCMLLVFSVVLYVFKDVCSILYRQSIRCKYTPSLEPTDVPASRNSNTRLHPPTNPRGGCMGFGRCKCWGII